MLLADSFLILQVGIFFGYVIMSQIIYDNVGILVDPFTCADVILFYFCNKITNFFQGKKREVLSSSAFSLG